MASLVEPFSATLSKADRKPAVLRRYQCRCGRPIFFRNSKCLACHAPLGYEPRLARVCALETAGNGTWTLSGWTPPKLYRRCANLTNAAACNWLLDADESQQLCRCCRLNRTIPDQTVPENAAAWSKIEIAKRRLVSSLIALGLPVHGLAFDFLRSLPGGPPVITGHKNGVITINVEEADDATRERHRQNLDEPYRTLLGHLRHEAGHYYWDRLVAGTSRYQRFRELFGDETKNYAGALQRHYNLGPQLSWQTRFVSAYASAHPWEDWAETWAHYMHISDTWDTALSFGVDVDAAMEVDGFTYDELLPADDPGCDRFLYFLNSWTQLNAVMNELSRAMGLPDFYPFVLSQSAVAKLRFVQVTIENAASENAASGT